MFSKLIHRTPQSVESVKTDHFRQAQWSTKRAINSKLPEERGEREAQVRSLKKQLKFQILTTSPDNMNRIRECLTESIDQAVLYRVANTTIGEQVEKLVISELAEAVVQAGEEGLSTEELNVKANLVLDKFIEVFDKTRNDTASLLTELGATPQEADQLVAEVVGKHLLVKKPEDQGISLRTEVAFAAYYKIVRSTTLEAAALRREIFNASVTRTIHPLIVYKCLQIADSNPSLNVEQVIVRAIDIDFAHRFVGREASKSGIYSEGGRKLAEAEVVSALTLVRRRVEGQVPDKNLLDQQLYDAAVEALEDFASSDPGMLAPLAPQREDKLDSAQLERLLGHPTWAQLKTLQHWNATKDQYRFVEEVSKEFTRLKKDWNRALTPLRSIVPMSVDIADFLAQADWAQKRALWVGLDSPHKVEAMIRQYTGDLAGLRKKAAQLAGLPDGAQ